MADGAIAIFGTRGFVDKPTAIEMTEEGTRWESPEVRDVHTIKLGDGSAALAYLAETKMQGKAEPYKAFVSSAYVMRNGRWQLAVHHQTKAG